MVKRCLAQHIEFGRHSLPQKELVIRELQTVLRAFGNRWSHLGRRLDSLGGLAYLG